MRRIFWKSLACLPVELLRCLLLVARCFVAAAAVQLCGVVQCCDVARVLCVVYLRAGRPALTSDGVNVDRVTTGVPALIVSLMIY